MRRYFWTILFLAHFLAIFSIAANANVPATTLMTELNRVKTLFANLVNDLKTKTAETYSNWVIQHSRASIAKNPDFKQSQYFIFVDRNPNRQYIFVCFFEAECGSVKIIGADKTSTGDPSRDGHFETPVGFFKNSPAIIGYRAKGTKNRNGIRGLGAKGSRVWDFGWTRTYKNGSPARICFALHGTDPDVGEPMLGHVFSKGCIHVSAKMNFFLDHYGIIDREYELLNQRKKISLLKEDREPVAFAGKYVLVGDSREQ
jgi:hypothetical protein